MNIKIFFHLLEPKTGSLCFGLRPSSRVWPCSDSLEDGKKQTGRAAHVALAQQTHAAIGSGQVWSNNGPGWDRCCLRCFVCFGCSARRPRVNSVLNSYSLCVSQSYMCHGMFAHVSRYKSTATSSLGVTNPSQERGNMEDLPPQMVLDQSVCYA